MPVPFFGVCFLFFFKAKESDHSKKSKRTPSFNIRRRTRSFKDKYKLPENLPPADLQANVDRKQELQSGGKKATIRSWKTFYTVLYGQLLAFFKDQEGWCGEQVLFLFPHPPSQLHPHLHPYPAQQS